jgi:phage shock protein A
MLRYAELRRQGNTPESVSARKDLLQQHTHAVEQTLAELHSNLEILRQKIDMYDAIEAALPANVVSQPSFSEDASHEHIEPRTSQDAGPPARR